MTGRGILYTADAFHAWMAHDIALTPWIPDHTDLISNDLATPSPGRLSTALAT
jgi:hypothetical protein